MELLNPDQVRQAVRQNYAEVAQRGNTCGCTATSCCSDESTPSIEMISLQLGYSSSEIINAPEGSNLGLGCGNPQVIAAIQPGETVIDLGSGAGFDCFLASRQVGNSGRVIGVDMTPEMIQRARGNAAREGYNNVEFRLGEIEHLPVADGFADVIISNCVINLSPDKPQVFREAFRTLKVGGRLAISDVVASAVLPEDIQRDLELLSGCIAGAALIGDIEEMLKDAGFVNIRITPKDESRDFIRNWSPGSNATDYVVSATIQAVKPPEASGFSQDTE
ncbi:MAG: arsenite S-adenosylmethyltransferase [Sulfobacillus benefaciens]|uniref:Arsenite methyltransferase n=1 Tax=Sulfobacillus benefaciens TaxID=453960 RepID=A0A2T2XFK0_9FIRM|nr:MAG: arsenite S-adenosylmethyltransferase [Sulfobacillus benefaciens]